MNRITLYTIPHTGTHFASKFFNTLGIAELKEVDPLNRNRGVLRPIMQEHNHWWRCHAAQGPSGDDAAFARSMFISAKKLVVTARDPYLSAIRYFSPGRRPMSKLLHRWNRFLHVLENAKYPYFVLDIGCREKDRYAHLLDLAEFLDIPYEKSVVEEYASNWKPENASNTGAKQKYLQTGTLPNLECDGSWNMLDEAVEWYKSLPTNDFGDK